MKFKDILNYYLRQRLIHQFNDLSKISLFYKKKILTNRCSVLMFRWVAVDSEFRSTENLINYGGFTSNCCYQLHLVIHLITEIPLLDTIFGAFKYEMVSNFAD